MSGERPVAPEPAPPPFLSGKRTFLALSPILAIVIAKKLVLHMGLPADLAKSLADALAGDVVDVVQGACVVAAAWFKSRSGLPAFPSKS